MSQHGLSVAQWFMDLGRWLFSIDIYRLLLHAFYVIFIARFSSIICVARHKKKISFLESVKVLITIAKFEESRKK